MAKILLIIAQEGYQVKEYEDTKKALVSCGHDVITASNQKGAAISNIYTKADVDIEISNININDYDGIYLIGGEGALHYLDNEVVHSTIKDIFENTNKPFGAICISPRILINAGVMKGLKMTGWNDDNNLKDLCDNAGSIYVSEPVVKDGRVITADGPMSAYNFGKMIGEQFE